MSYVIFPLFLSNTSITSFLNLSCTFGFQANSYKANDMVVEDVSNPPVKKIAACATSMSLL
jgi:hypothetical protein